MGCSNTKVPMAAYDQVVVAAPEADHTALPFRIASPEEGEGETDLTELRELTQRLSSVKESLRLLTYEKYGVQKTLDVAQEQLLELTTEQEGLKTTYQGLLRRVVERDVEDISNALNPSSLDKKVLLEILTNRPTWHVTMISEAYQRRHSVPLSLRIRETLTSQFGKLTGSKTGLSHLLEYITTDQPERDGRFLKAALGDLDLLLEVILTRTNRQLQAALNDFENKNGKSFLDAVRGLVSAPLLAFLSEACACRRDETGVPLTVNVAENTAAELAQAIVSKNLDLCTHILVNLSALQVSSILRQYNRIPAPSGGTRNLDQDLATHLSGDYRTALRCKCMEPFVFLASHIHSDRETICRILGSLSRRDCKLLRSAYDANKSSFDGKSFSDMLREEIKKESYLAACLNLISPDLSQLPLGVDREPAEDVAEVESIGEDAFRTARASYSQAEMQRIAGREAELFLRGIDMPLPAFPPHPTASQLTKIMSELEGRVLEVERQTKEVSAEIEQVREFLFVVTKQCAQCEKWSRIHKAYSASLQQFLNRSTRAPPPKLPSPKK